MAQINVTVQVHTPWWLKITCRAYGYALKVAVRLGKVSVEDAATRFADHMMKHMKYRIDKGKWKDFASLMVVKYEHR